MRLINDFNNLLIEISMSQSSLSKPNQRQVDQKDIANISKQSKQRQQDFTQINNSSSSNINNLMQKEDQKDSEMNQLDIAFIADQSRQPSDIYSQCSEDPSISIISKHTPCGYTLLQPENQISSMEEWKTQNSVFKSGKRARSQQENSDDQIQRMGKEPSKKMPNGKFKKVQYENRKPRLPKINEDNSNSANSEDDDVVRGMLDEMGSNQSGRKNALKLN